MPLGAVKMVLTDMEDSFTSVKGNGGGRLGAVVGSDVVGLSVCARADGAPWTVEATLTAMGANSERCLGAVTGKVVGGGAAVMIGAVADVVVATVFGGIGSLVAVTDGRVNGLSVCGRLRACWSCRRR